MTDKNIQAYLIQETHLQGDFTQRISGDLTFIHHSPKIQPTKGAKEECESSFQKNGWKDGRKEGA